MVSIRSFGHVCPLGILDCWVDQTGSSWRVPDGDDGGTPASFNDYYAPGASAPQSVVSELIKSSIDWIDAVAPTPQRSPGATPVEQGPLVPRGSDEDGSFDSLQKFGPEIFKKIWFPADPWLAPLIVQVAHEFVVAEEYLYLADEAYRVGANEEALAGYKHALEFIGDWADYPCAVRNRYRALRGEAEARLVQLRAGLDYMGRAADWAPHTPPDKLEAIVLSKLQHATAVAIDLKLNALVSMAAASQQAAIAEALNAADGDMAQLEQSVVDAHLKEKESRVDELTVYVLQAEAQIPILEAELLAYWETLSDPPEGLFDAISAVASKVFGFVSKV